MRKTTFFPFLLAASMLLVSISPIKAQLLVENFEYSIGAVLTTSTSIDPVSGWLGHNGSGTNNIPVVEGLTLSGYAGSGIGGAARLNISGQDINKTFAPQSTGSVYVAFLVRVESVTTTGDYFLNVGPSPISTTFRGRVFVRRDAANKLAFGISHAASTPPVLSEFVYDLNVTYLMVLRYTIIDGATNDQSAIFISPVPGQPEPAVGWITATDTGSDIAVGSVALRQGAATHGPVVVVDGIRVATIWAEAVAQGGVVENRVATPTMTPGTGNYVTPQLVALSSATPNATIYYTLDGSDPNESKTLYTGPISISSTTTLKARAYLAGMDASHIITAVYTFPTNVATLAELRAHTSGFFRYTGTATFTLISTDNTRGNPKYIQDATGAIVIHDPTRVMTTTYQVGDGITNIIGTLGVSSGMLQLTPVADAGAPLFSGQPITPVVVPLNELIQRPAQLVTVQNVTITGTGNFTVATNYNLNGAANPVLRVAYSDLPYIGTPIVAEQQNITGVVLFFNAVAQLVPRTATDFQLSTGLSQPSSAFKAFVSQGLLHVESPSVQKVEIFNAVGQLVHSSLLRSGMNTIDVPKGLHLVRVGKEVKKVIK